MAQATQMSQLLSDQQRLASASLKPPKLQDYVSARTDKELAIVSWASEFKNFLRPFNRAILLEEDDPTKLKGALGDNWKEHAICLYNDLRTAIGNEQCYIADVKLGNINHTGLSTENVGDERIASLAADWKEMEQSLSSSTSCTDVNASLMQRLAEISLTDQSAVEKIQALNRAFLEFKSVDRRTCEYMEWVICASAVVAILKKPNPGVRVSDWTNTAKDLLSTRESLTFMTLATKVGARSAELREVFGSSVSSSSHASAPKQVLHAGSAPSGRKGRKCTICSKSGHLAGDCTKIERSSNYGKSLAEGCQEKGLGDNKSSHTPSNLHLGAIY